MHTRERYDVLIKLVTDLVIAYNAHYRAIRKVALDVAAATQITRLNGKNLTPANVQYQDALRHVKDAAACFAFSYTSEVAERVARKLTPGQRPPAMTENQVLHTLSTEYLGGHLSPADLKQNLEKRFQRIQTEYIQRQIEYNKNNKDKYLVKRGKAQMETANALAGPGVPRYYRGKLDRIKQRVKDAVQTVQDTGRALKGQSLRNTSKMAAKSIGRSVMAGVHKLASVTGHAPPPTKERIRFIRAFLQTHSPTSAPGYEDYKQHRFQSVLNSFDKVLGLSKKLHDAVCRNSSTNSTTTSSLYAGLTLLLLRRIMDLLKSNNDMDIARCKDRTDSSKKMLWFDILHVISHFDPDSSRNRSQQQTKNHGIGNRTTQTDSRHQKNNQEFENAMNNTFPVTRLSE